MKGNYKILVYVAHIIISVMTIICIKKIYHGEDNAWWAFIGWVSAMVWANMALTLHSIIKKHEKINDDTKDGTHS